MFSISSWLHLEELCFSFMLFILSVYSCSQQSLMILYISVFFITDFIDLGTLSFFSMSLAQGVSVLFVFSKNQLLVSLIFSIVSLVSISFISVLIFIISFFLLTLCFVCSSFSGFFRNFFSHLPLLISIFFYLISSEYP